MRLAVKEDQVESDLESDSTATDVSGCAMSFVDAWGVRVSGNPESPSQSWKPADMTVCLSSVCCPSPE